MASCCPGPAGAYFIAAGSFVTRSTSLLDEATPVQRAGTDPAAGPTGMSNRNSSTNGATVLPPTWGLLPDPGDRGRQAVAAGSRSATTSTTSPWTRSTSGSPRSGWGPPTAAPVELFAGPQRRGHHPPQVRSPPDPAGPGRRRPGCGRGHAGGPGCSGPVLRLTAEAEAVAATRTVAADRGPGRRRGGPARAGLNALLSAVDQSQRAQGAWWPTPPTSCGPR